MIAVGSWYNGRFFSNSFIMLRTGCSEPEKNEQEKSSKTKLRTIRIKRTRTSKLVKQTHNIQEKHRKRTNTETEIEKRTQTEPDT